jgi:fatty-acyl-CoA synthase
MTSRDGNPAKQSRQAWTRALALTAGIGSDAHRTLPALIDELAVRHDAGSALTSKDTTLSYRELAAQARRYARWGLASGLQRGEVVGLLMPNRPDYVALWLGLTRIGVTVALLNTNIRHELLAHALQSVDARALIVDPALTEAWQTARPLLSGSVHALALNESQGGYSEEPLTPDEAEPPELQDRALYIYTSGTTGAPKAAHISHWRLMQWSHWFAGLMDTGPQDRLYNCLPLYHSVGGIVAVGATLVGGGTVVLRERFSAREFWSDVVQERCTLFQYIGELCRYLVNSPPHAQETAHQLRLCCGNGLRAEIWATFQQRFRIPQILEYYAATEASFSLYNCEGRVGAVGRIPPFLSHRLQVALIQTDPDSGAPLRDASGRCLRAAIGEPGEALGLVRDASGLQAAQFEGYADPQATEHKLLHDVFESGDLWYRSGDLMRQDTQGFFYFVDRLGDTFRWKGENVSTAEVGAVIASIPGVRDVAVYGVAVPGCEGRAGMAALAVDDTFDLSALRAQLSDRLPDYAQPLFLRLVPGLELTGTFRPSKRELMLAGYDPASTQDPLYLNDRPAQRYVRLDAHLFAEIERGALAR